MAAIFISYSSEDRERARTIADALSARGWSVWWDRKIPLGKSFDEVIEKALAEAKCVIVLWSPISAASEWVRNEASEAKRRGILIPVFIEPVDAPLAFRLLNGANLCDWDPASANPEFDKLTERITELLGASQPVETQTTTPKKVNRFRTPVILGALAVVIVAAALGGYFFRRGETSPTTSQNPSPIADPPSAGKAIAAGGEANDIQKSIDGLAGILGGAVPATSLAKGFYVPDLGVRIAFLTAEQSASTLGTMPPGAVVLEVESDRPMAKAGIQAGDLVVSIAGKKIGSENDLRQAILQIGAGKTAYTYRRGAETRTVTIDCSTCKPG